MTEQPQNQPQDRPQDRPQDPGQQQPPPYQPAPPAPQQPPFQARPPGGYRRLTRTANDSPISGVCGGVARYLGVDPTLVRVLAVIAAVVTFPVGPIVYAVMWAVMPKE